MHATPASSQRAAGSKVPFLSWPGVFPAAVCDAAIAAFDDYELAPAGVETASGERKVVAERRAASHLFIDPEHWVGALVTHFAHQGNLVWGREVVGLGTLSIVRYDEGGHFTWHIDDVAYQAQSYAKLGDDLDRKISVSVNLSDPADYDGGELEFRDGLGHQVAGPDLRQRGSVVVFPSSVGHRVTPVARGSRFALIGWMVGPPLR